MAGFWMILVSKLTNYAICRLTVAFSWFYHGLVPKLLGPHPDEIAMSMAIGLSQQDAVRLGIAAGAAEIVFAVTLLAFWRHRWPLVISAVSMICLLIFVAVSVPTFLSGAFNAVTTNLCVLALSVVALRLRPE